MWRRLKRASARLMCAVTGHIYVLEQKLGGGAEKVACYRCKSLWAVYAPTMAVIPWDAEFEALYSPGGALYREDGSEQN